MSFLWPWDECAGEEAFVGGSGTVDIAVIERKKKAIVAIDERTRVQHLNLHHFILFNIQNIHAVRIAVEAFSGQAAPWYRNDKCPRQAASPVRKYRRGKDYNRYL